MKNIAFLHDNFPLGGAERITIDTATYLSSKEYCVYVFVRRINSDKKSTELEHSYLEVLLPDQTHLASKTNATFMLRFMQGHHISVLITKEPVLSLISFLKKNQPNLRMVFINHGVPFWEIKQKEALKAYKRAHGIRILENLKWFCFEYFKYEVFRFHKKKIVNLYRQLYAICDSYIVLCEEYAYQIEKVLQIDHTDSKIRVIHNSESEVQTLKLTKKKQLLFVGRLSYSDKRVDRLLDIWSMVYENVPEWELIIVGDGSQRKKLEEKVCLQSLPRVSFIGHTNEISPFYQEASILCLTSTVEGWPLCLTEAQANGVVPIAFGCSAGVKSILSPDKECGFIISPFNLEEYASVLSGLMNNPALLEQIRPRLVEKAKEYGINKIGPLWIQLFEELER